MADITNIMTLSMRQLTDDSVQMALELSSSEAAFSVNMINETSTVPLAIPTDAALQNAVLRQGMDTPLGPDQLTIGQALNQFSRSKSREVIDTINDSILIGETTKQAADKVGELVSTRQRKHVDTLTRTIVNFTSAQSRQVTLTENSGILDGYEWVATLDSRTTLICGGRDGRVYPVGGGPLPPAHWNCRSTVIPVVSEDFRIDAVAGSRPAIGDKRGTVSAKSTYGGWLKKQSAGFQDEVLGPERAKLFRSGGLSIDRFRDETGKIYTLDQLRALEPLAFQRAGIE
jgi:SPP1 gp7 family putative phage head morphogenesis protein